METGVSVYKALKGVHVKYISREVGPMDLHKESAASWTQAEIHCEKVRVRVCVMSSSH